MATLLFWFGVTFSLILVGCFVFYALQGHGDRGNLRLTLLGIVGVMVIAVFWYQSPHAFAHLAMPAQVAHALHALQTLTEAVGAMVLIGLICFVILLIRIQSARYRAMRMRASYALREDDFSEDDFPRASRLAQQSHGICAECRQRGKRLAFYEYQYARGERLTDKLCNDCALRFGARRVHSPLSYADF